MHCLHKYRSCVMILASESVNKKGAYMSIFVPPINGVVYEIGNVPVWLDEPWNQAVRSGAPDTWDGLSLFRPEAADEYPPNGEGVKEIDFLLLNPPIVQERGWYGLCPDGAVEYFPALTAKWAEILSWAKQYPQLRETYPREVLAISKHRPNLFYFSFSIIPPS